ncbi:MAG: MmgE/PrpD family protein [Clostridiales bacterium]|nr:MmgE/PrpD family protein [Clostridiales bacterium]
MDGKTLTMQVAEYSVADHWDTFQEEDIRMTKLAFADWVAAAQTGAEEEGTRILLELAGEEDGRQHCSVIGQEGKYSPGMAALINGNESHGIDFDDIHVSLSLHLCSPLFPAALAATEMSGAGGKELINAAINGFQVMVALSSGIMPEHYNIGRWHATGTIGIFGAAAAAGAILKATPMQMCHAFGICAGLCSGIQLNFGSMAKPLAAGMAAKNGLLAVIMAQRGFTGRTDIFDTDFLENISLKKVNRNDIIERLHGAYGVHELRFKRYPCGAPTHSGIINCKKILEESPHPIENIERIVFEPYPRAIRLVGNMDPQTGLQGKFSIGFTAAAQIVFGAVTIDTFTDEKVKDPRIQYLLKRMELVACDEFTPSRGGRTTIYFTDGTSRSHATYLLGGEVDPDEVFRDTADKYEEIMIPVKGKAGTQASWQAIMTMEQRNSISEMTKMLRK